MKGKKKKDYFISDPVASYVRGSKISFSMHNFMNFDINQTAFYSGNKVSKNERKKIDSFCKNTQQKND